MPSSSTNLIEPGEGVSSHSYLGNTTTSKFARSAKTTYITKSGNNAPYSSIGKFPPSMQMFSYNYIATTLPRGYYSSRERQLYGDWSHSYGSGQLDTNTYRTAAHLPESFSRSSIDRKLATSVLLDIKAQKINVAVAAAEMNKTMNMIATNAIRIAQAITSARKGDLRGAASAVGLKSSDVSRRASKRHSRNVRKDQEGAVASGWLELQYGWKPLLNDIYGAAEELSKGKPREMALKLVKSKTHKEERTVVENGTYGAGSQSTTMTRRQYTKKYVLYYQPTNSGQARANALGLMNPLVVAWELVPYSFVIDWFLPIGDYLQQLDATVGFTFVTGCLTTYERAYTSRTDIKTVKTAGFSSELFSLSDYETVSVGREVLTNFPSPVLPVPKNPASLLHAANALALLVNLRK